MNPTHKKVLRYVLLPQAAPRFKALLSSGFGYASFYMAMVFRAARVLPADHAYLNAANIGRFGMRHVIAEAASNIEWRRDNIDQITVFGLILTGLVMLALQLCLLIGAMLMQTAQASLPKNYAEFFVTKAPQHDIAFVLMDRVFGIEGMFGSCVDTNVPCYNNQEIDGGYPLHAALHSVMQFYSIGLLVVAVLILAYFIMAVLAETAQSGTPFGKRFNHAWAPIRLVVALGLLIPMGSGLNAAQYITLYAAKWGSGFATNGWLLFIDKAVAAEETLLGNKERLIAHPETPPINELAVFFTTAGICAQGLKSIYNRPIEGYLINPNATGPAPKLDDTDFEKALEYYQQSGAESARMLFYFGDDGQTPGAEGEAEDKGLGTTYTSSTQNILPACGVITLEITDLDKDGSQGSRHINEQYYCLIQQLWGASKPGGGGGGSCGGGIGSMGTTLTKLIDSTWKISTPVQAQNKAEAQLPSIDDLKKTMTDYHKFITNAIENGVKQQTDSEHWTFDLKQLGWAGAGIWYNRVAQMNGALIAAAHNMPHVLQYPEIMEEVQRSRSMVAKSMMGMDRFNPYQPGGDELVPILAGDRQDIARALYAGMRHWDGVATPASGNFLIDMVQSIFGLDGLFSMTENADIHPLAQLVGIGKSIINRAVINLGDSFIGFGVASLSKALDANLVSSAATAIGSFQGSVAMMGLGIGFVLFYFVPFLPFMYFFFAVGGWIKSIFEAMVGVPLWALAHLRIDGNGLPGDAALGGYVLILEIFLRPILIVFGLLASIAIFGAQVKVLHEIWHIVVSNVSGMNREAAETIDSGLTGSIEFLRNPIDQFFYTVIYAIIVYMMALSSFKLIDQIPDNILRWLGNNPNTFQDSSGEEASNAMRNAAITSNMIVSDLKGATSSLTRITKG